MAARRTRLYAKVERRMWKTAEFRQLPRSARIVWNYLLQTPKTSFCPGFIEASALAIAEDIGTMILDEADEGMAPEEQLMKVVMRVNDGLSHLENKKRDKDGLAWIIVDRDERLILLTRAISHNLPSNRDVLVGWMRGVGDLPASTLRNDWLTFAELAVRTAFGSRDVRSRILRRAISQIKQKKDPFAVEVSASIGKTDTVSPPSGHGVSHTVVINSNSNSNNNSNREGGEGGGMSHNDDRKPASQAPHPTGQSSFSLSKPTERPQSFTRRQADVWLALRDVKFYKKQKGGGEQTVWENVDDPIRLAQTLGDDETFPAVDIGLIKRLAAWSFENKAKSKTKLGAFLLNRFRASQERGGDRRGRQQQDAGEYQFGDDLEAKLRKDS